MAYAKKKKVGKNAHAFNIENSLPAVHKTRRVRQVKETSEKVNQESGKIITSVIVMTILIVILSTLATTMSTPERIVKGKIDELVADYYENYFYDNLIAYIPASKSLDSTIGKYTNTGFTHVPFAQLFTFDEQRHGDLASYISGYCDTDRSYFTIYPKSPYGPTDYYIKYDYSCKF